MIFLILTDSDDKKTYVELHAIQAFGSLTHGSWIALQCGERISVKETPDVIGEMILKVHDNTLKQSNSNL